ncbi:proacrosin, putative [Anopheles sinensis]|uniref:Proacrosin, putative n=1 Tax=Anopheles sinensis TaxID=74873 RepID=A0A084VHM6_ANOSI|nr:proacrosin, putative [Anopheles sinensis]
MVCCPPSNLVHGLDGYEAEVPFIAALGFKRENPNESSFTWFCGSSLITSRFLLTTAHCTRYTDKPLIARMGTSNLLEAKQENNFIQDRNVKRTFPHPNYTSHSKENDIALIEVDHPFIFSANVMGICLSTIEEDRDETDQLFAAGWGATDYKTASPEKLMRVALTTVPLDKCREQYKLLQSTSFSRKFKINDTQYCAITKPTNETFKRTPCKGDSGGPLYYESNTSGRPNYLLVGIISAGINCGENIPEPYVRVASYLDWIDSVIETL